ncbi:hypothetical protein JCM10450v2_008395 [Rhodotorula kratochvilovae]
MTGILDKAKHALHLDDETDDPVQYRHDLDVARDKHRAEEARADALAAEREADLRAHPSHGHTLEPVQAHELSSVPHRAPLSEAAHGHAQVEVGRATTPDLEGVTHIPEDQLPERKPRMEHTALRPSDPNDVNSMNGKVYPLNVAGDDYAP